MHQQKMAAQSFLAKSQTVFFTYNDMDSEKQVSVGPSPTKVELCFSENDNSSTYN